MIQSRTHTCGELRLGNVNERVTLAGWMENVRVVGSNFAFLRHNADSHRNRSDDEHYKGHQ